MQPAGVGALEGRGTAASARDRPDSQTRLGDWDDDDGAGYNARVVADLVPGTYYVQIRHYNRQGGTGAYAIQVGRND